MTAILIDDDPDCNFVLATLLGLHCPDVSILQICTNIEEGQQSIEKYKPDLVFLDVEIGANTGFDLLKRLMPIHFEVVFVTGFEKYARQAIKFSAVDFLTKPVETEELKEAVAKVKQRLSEKKALNPYEFLLELVEAQQQKRKLTRMLLPHPQYGTEVVLFEQISFLKADGPYTQFTLTDSRTILVSKNIGIYEQEMEDFSFLKVHRSYLVNLDQVRYYNKGDDALIMRTGEQIPVSRQGKDLLAKVF